MKNDGPAPGGQPPAIDRPPEQVPARPPWNAEDEGQLFDWTAIARYTGFVLRSVRRHKLLFLLVWLGVIGASLGTMAVLPKTYHVETELQAQRNQVISSLSNPGHAQPLDNDAPTRQAAETVLRHDNLAALIAQTDLIKNWSLHRAPALRLKDWIWRKLFKPQPPDEVLEGFIYYLASRFSVTTGDGTITIGIDWPDGQLAYHLVENALQNFLEARHAADVSSITDAITILESRASQAYDNLDKSLQQLEAARGARAERLGRKARRARPESVAQAVNPEVAQLLVQIQGKRRAIADLEEFRRRRISELQTRLSEQRAVYSENHPLVLDTQQSLEALYHDSPQLLALRRELADLEENLRKRGMPLNATLGEVRATPAVPSEAQLTGEDPRESEDPHIEYIKEQVRYDLNKYTSFLDRIESARIELDTARAAFKYRYTILRPVRMPRSAVKPKPLLIFAASLVAGLFLAIAATALRDLQSRRLVENWQVEQLLDVPMLGDVETTT